MNLLPSYFANIPDPREASNAQRHELVDILMIALCAVLSGAETFVEMEDFGLEKQSWLQERLGLHLPSGIPSHDTFGRVFARLDPQAFGAAMQTWTQALNQSTKGQVLALDGKTVRRSFDTATGKAALHVVSAWATQTRMVLAQQAVADKSNEITALPTLLEMLDIRGCVVTVDALNSQKEIAARIVEGGGDYVMALKSNHALLYEEVRDYCLWCHSQPGGLERLANDAVAGKEWGHGRVEVRRCYAIAATPQDWPRALQQWLGLQSIVVVHSSRGVRTHTTGTHTTGTQWRFYLSSLKADAAMLQEAVRSHWQVENNVHWCLDVAFDEDHSRARKDHSAKNLAVLRRLALNLLRSDKTAKSGLKARRLRIGWNNEYLLRIICSANS